MKPRWHGLVAKRGAKRRALNFWQPRVGNGHRPGHMLNRIGVSSLLLASAFAAVSAWPAAAQTAVSQASMPGELRPALAQVGQTVNGVDPRHWKVPGDVKSAIAGDVEAIQRDLAGTLAGLLEQADAAPGSVPAQFAVYRNVDALYDTLLRVVETAELAAPREEAASLEAALSSLETVRGQLGDAIAAGAQTQQGELTVLRRAISSAEAAQRAPVKTTVVDDWSSTHPSARRTPHKRRAPAKKPASSTSGTAAAGGTKPNPQ